MSASTSPPAGPWESVAYPSPSRLTRMTKISLPGAGGGTNKSLSTLTPTYPNMMVTCTDSGGGFVKDQTYIRSSDNTKWIGIAGGTHLHNTDTESGGGLLTDIMMANQTKIFQIHKINPVATDFSKEGSSSATATDIISAGRLDLTTGTTTGNWVHMSNGGVRLSYGFESRFLFKGNVEYAGTNSNLTSYIGVGVAAVNSSTNQLQYGIQVCDSAGIERNWEMVQANGTTKGVVATTERVNQGSPRGYKLKYTPGFGTQFWVNGVLNQTNTQAVVASGINLGVRNISFGIRTNNSTTKTLHVYGVSLFGTIGDQQWV
jgi:hypothetical protein